MRHISLTTLLAACASLFASGCGVSGGQALFMFGLFDRPEIEAKFKLGEGPVVVLVDDFQELCFWPETPGVLATKTTEELDNKDAAKILISPTKVRQLRQTAPDFDEWGAREIGRKLDADQVLWLQITDFDAAEDAHEVHNAARITVTLKVINALEETDRNKVRLWPPERDGRIVDVEIGAGAVTRAKNRAGIVDALCEKLAEKVVKNFYDRLMEDFEEK
jgi:hypothetical protein